MGPRFISLDFLFEKKSIVGWVKEATLYKKAFTWPLSLAY